MAVPNATTEELDGQVGNQAPSSGLPMAIVGPATAGAFTPGAFQSSSAVREEYDKGGIVEAAAYALDTFGVNVVIARTAASEAHAYSAVDDTLLEGTTTPTVVTATPPADHYQCRVKFEAGGAVGTPGIKYRLSLDDGLTYSPAYPLGAASFIEFPDTGGVRLNLSAGTVEEGDEVAFTATPARWTSSELGEALALLGETSRAWEFVQIVEDLDITSALVVASFLQSQHAANKHRWAIGSFRARGPSESVADYYDAFELFRASVASTSLVVTLDRADMLSAYAKGRLRRPPSMSVAALCAAVSEEIDPAAIDEKYSGDAGPLPGVTIRDARGNLKYIDAQENGSAFDDIGASVLRTWDGYSGVYPNNVRLLSAPDSDFQYLPSRRVMNVARTVLNRYMVKRLSKGLVVDRRTGFVRADMLETIEAGANAVLEAALLTKPKASAVQFVASRNDPILSSPHRLTGRLRMVGLAYPKEIVVQVSWAVTLQE